MKKTIRLSRLYALAGVVLCAILVSFSPRPGAHSYRVYFDSKLMIDQYVKSSMDAPTLHVDPAENYRQIIVKYNECRRTVTGRMILLKNEQDKVLRDWKFEGASTGYEKSMECNLKDITAWKQKESDMLKLYYSSKEFPEGQLIAKLVIGGNASTALK